jgi:hypothetical protein
MGFLISTLLFSASQKSYRKYASTREEPAR